MKMPESLKGIKNSIAEKAMNNRGVYLSVHIPYLGDYACVKDILESITPDDKINKPLSVVYASILGTGRVLGIGASVYFGLDPIGTPAILFSPGSIESVVVAGCRKLKNKL